MKIRASFVSNSSASSFVLLGFEDTEDKKSSELYKEYPGLDVIWNGKKFLIGVLFDNVEQNNTAKNKKIDIAAEIDKLAISNHKKAKDIKLYLGTQE